MPWGAAVFVAAPVAGARIRRSGERPFLTGGLLLVSAGATWLALAARPDLAYWQLAVPLVLTGLGFSAAIPAAQSSVLSHVAPQYIGKASGTFTMLRKLCTARAIRKFSGFRAFCRSPGRATFARSSTFSAILAASAAAPPTCGPRPRCVTNCTNLRRS